MNSSSRSSLETNPDSLAPRMGGSSICVEPHGDPRPVGDLRAIGLDPKVTEQVSEWRFRQLAREGAAAPAFLLDEYGPRRRRATLVAQLFELETRLSDAPSDVRPANSWPLTKARKRIERRYQATAKEVADLMHMLSSTIDVLSEARDAKSDPFEALDNKIGWNRLLAAKPTAAELGKKADEDPLIKACDRYMTVRRFAPKFLESFTFRASSDKHPLLSAIELLKRRNKEPRRTIPKSPHCRSCQKPGNASL